MISMIKFKLKKEQIEFLKKTYPDNKLIQRVLSFEKEGIFEMASGQKPRNAADNLLYPYVGEPFQRKR